MSDFKEKIVGLLQENRDLTTQDFMRAMPGIPAQTVHSRIRKLLQDGSLSVVSRGVYRRGFKMHYSVLVTPWMLEVSAFLRDNLPGTDNGIYEKDGNLYVEVHKSILLSVVNLLKGNYPAVAKFVDARPLLNDIRGFILVKSMPTESPMERLGGVSVPSLEKTLVDAADDDSTNVMGLFQAAFEVYQPNRSTLLRYASRKGIKPKVQMLLDNLNDDRINLIGGIQDFFRSQPVEKAWLFGSFARGEETPSSDLDILVAFTPDAHVSLLAHARMTLALEQNTGRSVDLVTEGTLLPFALESAEHDKILIYERAG
jgi:hypothetical protein